MIEILGLLDDLKSCSLFKNKISDSTSEMSTIFREVLPCMSIEKTTGICFRWNELFIEKCLIAMATDDIINMSEMEKEVWDYFVLFQDEGTLLFIDKSESLEQYFLDLYNCVEPNKCTKTMPVLEEVAPC